VGSRLDSIEKLPINPHVCSGVKPFAVKKLNIFSALVLPVILESISSSGEEDLVGLACLCILSG